MSLPTRYEYMLESVAFDVAKALYKMLDTGTMEDKLVGFEVNLDAFGTYQEENEQLKKGIIDCLFKGESLQIFAEEMGLIE